MKELVTQAKHAARRLQRSIERGEVGAFTVGCNGEPLKRRHCLHAIAAQLGFRNWPHALHVLSRTEAKDLGTFMFYDAGGAIWNIWSASYEEARGIRAESGGFLLPYRHQFQIVETHYIALLGLDPSHADWGAIGRDWIEPADVEAWTRLARRRLDVLLGTDSSRQPSPL